jgi:porin
VVGRWRNHFRRNLKESGITFDNNLTSFYYGVAGGGEAQEFRYAGHGDYLMNADLMKMGGPPGLFLKIRAEHRMGESIGEPAGSLLPPVLASDLPTPDTRPLFNQRSIHASVLRELCCFRWQARHARWRYECVRLGAWNHAIL